MATVASEHFKPMPSMPPDVVAEVFRFDGVDGLVGESKDRALMIVSCVLAGLSVLLFLSRLCFRPPRKLQSFLAGLFGAPVGALATVQAIYFYWNSDGSEAPLVYGLVAGNRARWCSDQSSCKIFFCTFCILNVVSIITQLLIWSGFKEFWTDKKYAPVPFKHPRLSSGANGNATDSETEGENFEGEQGSETYQMNLHTPRSCWIFLTAVVTLSCIASVCFTYFVKWANDTATNFLVALIYILTNAFCLWSIIEFFLLTLWFHSIRLVCGMPPLPKENFRNGLERQGRTILAYCLLSKTPQSSEECFATAMEAHLSNLDPNMRITTGVVSVTGAMDLVKLELDLRDRCREEIRQRLTAEMQVALDLTHVDPDQLRYHLRHALYKVSESSLNRVDFWHALMDPSHGSAQDLPRRLGAKIAEASAHFVYLHRTCKILKKPGQYQDLMILASTGNNRAYTYLDTDYGKDGRKKGSECFGFSGNVTPENGTLESNAAMVKELERRGKPDVELISSYGADPKNRYFYTMVLDSDTICPAVSIRTLIESAEHPANRSFGIINANLAVDYTASEDCTWHMWRNALMEVSTVNLVRGQFWIFNRTGFYGKGLIRNDMYISRLIGMPGELVEALPVDILSHDTVEAKLLQPAVNVNVTLYEDVARNPISALSQSTRWMFGEVKNACYHPDGSYRGIIKLLTLGYTWLVECKPREKVWVRWREVPCSVSAEYLSHTGFRLFHAGPGILLVNIATSLLAEQKLGLELQVLPVVGMYAFLFTVLALFIIPKGFLMLDKLPSLNLGRFLLCTGKSSKIGDGEFSSEDEYEHAMLTRPPTRVIPDPEDSEDSDDEEEEKLDRCSVLMRQLALALVEITLSILLFSPELIIGVVRLVNGAWAQVKGKPNWQPQDAVEKEIEQNLNFCFVFRKTWLVFACGVAYLLYAIICQMQDAVVYLLIVSWILYPFTTYWMCLPVPSGCKSSFFWKWVMDVKRNQG